MAIDNYMELVEMVENRLGWVPEVTPTRDIWKARGFEAGRLKKLTETNPKLYSLRNLELTVEYLWRKREPVKSPVGLQYHVEDAVKLAEEPTVARPLGDLIDQAVALEYEHEAPDYEMWLGRLRRAFGLHRQDVYSDWLEARGSAWVK